MEWLVGAIANVWRECKLFEDLAGRWGLDIEVKDGKGEGVAGYEKAFGEVSEGIRAGRCGIWEGMVLLWATEKVFYSYFVPLPFLLLLCFAA